MANSTVGPVSLFGALSEAFAVASKQSSYNWSEVSGPTVTTASETISEGLNLKLPPSALFNRTSPNLMAKALY